MRDRIRARLRQYRTRALLSIVAAVNKTKSKFGAEPVRLNSHGYYRSINENNEAGFAQYMDGSAEFIRQVAPGSSAEYVDELWDGGHKLKQEIMAKMDRENSMTPGNSTRAPTARKAQSRKLPRSHSLQISGAALARSKFNLR